jgi:hypothetical protein
MIFITFGFPVHIGREKARENNDQSYVKFHVTNHRNFNVLGN